VRLLRHTWAIARRELGAEASSPVALVAWVVFLAVQGLSFFALLATLADPERPAPYGAVLRSHFGGSVLYWAFLFFVAAALTMRLVADERRRGTWELLRTTAVHEAAIVLGKWLGAVIAWCVLWAPTWIYVVLLAAFAPEGGGPDVGPVVTAYLGVLVTGCAFLAVGLFMSTLTDSQILAALLTFALLIGWLLVGVLPEIGALATHGEILALAKALDVRAHMDDFARGVVDSRHLAIHVGVTIFFLAGSAAAMGPRPIAAARRAVLGVALVAAGVLLAGVLLFRHPLRVDATRARVYTLEPRTRTVLAELRRPVRAYVLTASEPAFAPLYDEVRQVLALFAAESPLLSVEAIDLSRDPGRILAIAREHALGPEEVSGGGAVILAASGPDGERHRTVALLDMAEFVPGEVGGRLASFRAEAELAGALLDVAADEAPEVCFSTAHGELPLAAEEGGEGDDLSQLAAALQRSATRVSEIDALDPIPPRCAVLALVGPRRPLAAGEQRALTEYLAQGGRLFAAVDADLAEDDTLMATGLERVLDRYGLRFGQGVVVDPAGARGDPLHWATSSGYGEHPVSASFRGRRITDWTTPRWIEPISLPDVVASPLVSSSVSGWAELDLGTLFVERPTRDPGREKPGPVSVAAAAESQSGARIVLFGAARPLGTRALTAGGAAGDALAASAIAWLSGRRALVGTLPKTPEQVRVALTSEQLGRLFWICVFGVPGVIAAAAGGFAWWRRREKRE
jgi:ABC-2 type transport system permease protein